MAWSRFEKACAGLIALGLASRLLVFWYRLPDYDASWYMTMGKTLIHEHEFTAPWLATTAFTQHFPPAYPAIFALAFVLAGERFVTAGVVSVLVACFLVAVAFFTTRDLYGRPRAFAVAAIVATFSTLTTFDTQLLSESLVAAFFALTIWGIVKSLDKPAFILVAGAFAGLGYLTKASMGPFFLLAGFGGFLWRFYYVRWRVFRDKWYLLAAAIFACFVLPWAARNVIRHGWPHWETQVHATESLATFFATRSWPLVLTQELLWGGVILLAFALPFLPEIARSLRRIKEERTSALWLAIVTPSFIGIVFAAAFSVAEGRPIVRHDTIRYLLAPLIPMLWLGVRELDFGEDAPREAPASGAGRVRARTVWLAAGVAIATFFLFANPAFAYVSPVRLAILVVGAGAGLACVLVARAHRWEPAWRDEGKGATRSWRAVAARAPAPSVLLALVAFAFAIWILLDVAFAMFALLAGGAISLAAASPRARVIALCACAIAVPMVHYNSDSSMIRATEDVDALAPPGAVVAVEPGHEHYVYPFLRDDLRMVTPDRPHDYYVAIADYVPAAERPGYHLVANESTRWRAGPGTAVAFAVWGALLGDQTPAPEFMQARVYARDAST